MENPDGLKFSTSFEPTQKSWKPELLSNTCSPKAVAKRIINAWHIWRQEWQFHGFSPVRYHNSVILLHCPIPCRRKVQINRVSMGVEETKLLKWYKSIMNSKMAILCSEICPHPHLSKHPKLTFYHIVYPLQHLLRSQVQLAALNWNTERSFNETAGWAISNGGFVTFFGSGN